LECKYQFILSILFPTDVTYRVRTKPAQYPMQLLCELTLWAKQAKPNANVKSTWNFTSTYSDVSTSYAWVEVYFYNHHHLMDLQKICFEMLRAIYWKDSCKILILPAFLSLNFVCGIT